MVGNAMKHKLYPFMSKKTGLMGAINSVGDVVIPANFKKVFPFLEGLAGALDPKSGRWGYINSRGEWVIEPSFHNVWRFSCGRAFVQKEKAGLWSVIDQSGNLIASCCSDEQDEYSSNLVTVEVGGKSGLMNSSGELVAPYVYSFIGRFREGLAPFRKNWHVGFLDETGLEIEPDLLVNADRSSWAMEFSEGMAAVKVEYFWGYVDHAMEFVIHPKFPVLLDFDDNSFPGVFSEGLASIVWKDHKRGFIDMSGEFVFSPDYLAAKDFSFGLAPVLTGNGWGFVNREGTMAIKDMFRWVLGFTGPLTWVRSIAGEDFYLSQDGALFDFLR